MGQMMQKSKVASAVFDMVEPAVRCVANDLQVLTALRPGKQNRFPSVLDVYETTLVFLVFRYMLMYAPLREYDVRWEEKINGKFVDLWLRHLEGGETNLIEAGDWNTNKVCKDIKKMKDRKIKQSSCYFLALFRNGGANANDPASCIAKSLERKNQGLNPANVEYNPKYCRSIRIGGPAGRIDVFGYALLKGK